IGLYFIVLIIISALYINHVMPMQWIISGSVQILFFFLLFPQVMSAWQNFSEKHFRRIVFGTALFIRIAYVFLSYAMYMYFTGEPFEFDAGDAHFYTDVGTEFGNVEAFLRLDYFREVFKIAWSDMGHVLYIALIYLITGSNIIVPRLLSALLSAYMCVLIYKLAKRHFGELPARYAAVIAVLLHNFIYYCGLSLKEMEMTFLVVLFLERADYALRAEVLHPKDMILPVLSGGLLFLFRTALGASLWMSFFGALLFSEGRMMKWKNRVVVGFFMGISAIALFSGSISEEVNVLWENRQSNQINQMNYRANRINGNKLATYGTGALFAPAILTIPLPTFVNVETQQNQMYQNGGYLQKQVLGFFVYVALFLLIFKYKSYRRHLLLLLFLFSYLGIIAFSSFAVSERFHLPSLPVFVILAGFGITQVSKKMKAWYVPYLFLVALIVIGWNVFKLTGHGMI
ncbi:MAG: glycosyltransferase family 39 protein, partial [Paludibacteraceae bacterium]|nr:glycosyltransferase family 39 protein [Paludibacteraceae bacterium]